MLLKLNTSILVLLPNLHYISRDNSFIPSGIVSFYKKQFEAYQFSANSNIKLQDVKIGICQNGFFHGFGVGNYGVSIQYQCAESNTRYTQLITWRGVLSGGLDERQVLEKRNSF